VIAAAALVIGLAATGWLVQSSQSRLASARNLNSRLATWEAAAVIAVERPLFGVGLTNYTEHFNRRYSRSDQWQSAIANARPMAYPHSNALWIGAELGVVAFAIYVVANLCLFGIGYKGWRQAESPRQKAAAGCFLALLAVYSIPGLTLTSGAYSDLNLYYFFFLGLVSRRLFVQSRRSLQYT
jgi:O-antigen ligase